jgi:carbon monoxide dehydrogenase subunit G
VKELTPSGTDTYRATIEVGVGPVKGTYAGQVSITDKTSPERLTLRIEGGGKPGTIRATGELHLEEQDGRTVVRYNGDAQVTGLVASVGHRLMSGVAKQMAGEFFRALEGELSRS